METVFIGAVTKSLYSFITSVDFWYHAGLSFLRVITGVALGVLYALALIALGRLAAPVSSAIFGINSALRYAPPTAFIGIIIILLGLGGEAAVALICLGTAPYIFIMFSDTLSQRPSAYDDFIRLYRMNNLHALVRILVPYALPGWIRSVRVNLGAGWTFLIVAEMIGSQNGVGYLLALSQRFLRMPELVALIIIIGAIGLATDIVLARLQAWAAPWQGKYYG